MANGLLNGHAPTVTNGHSNSSSAPSRLPSETQDTEDMEDTVEFRLMMAYAQRRRPGGRRSSAQGTPQGGMDTNTAVLTETCEEKEVKTKKKRGLIKSLRKLFICGRAERGEEVAARHPAEGYRCSGAVDDDQSREELEELVSRLAELSDTIQFTPSDVDTDGEEDEVERLIGLMLRESGDRFHEGVLKDTSLGRDLFGNYSFYERFMQTFLSRMGLRPSQLAAAQGSQKLTKMQIAFICEVTNRLSAVRSCPTTRLMGFGAKYLQQHYSPWVTQQGGYDVVFVAEDEEEVH